jgi:hypothetical protein
MFIGVYDYGDYGMQRSRPTELLIWGLFRIARAFYIPIPLQFIFYIN